MIMLFIAATIAQAQVGIGTFTPDPSAIFELKASNRGLLMPRTSTTSRLSITNPAKGLLLYDTTASSFWFYQDTAWANVSIDKTQAGIPTPGDYDGDGKADLSVYYPAEKKWVVRKSLTMVTTTFIFNIPNTNLVPVPADYDGDAKTDMSLYDNANKKWFILKSVKGAFVTIDF